MSLASTRALATKEVRHLFPLIVALLALELLGLLEWFVANSPDEFSWVEVSVLLSPNMANIANTIYVIIGIVTAYMLLPHEYEQKTQQFLWSLPVARWKIFVVKMCTALVVLSGILLIGHLLLLWTNSFSIGSISTGQFTWTLWWKELAVLTGVTLIALGYGSLVACYRIVGILGFIAFWAVAQVLGYVDISFAYFDVTNLLVAEFSGTDILLDAKTWKVQSAIALVCLVLAGFRWTRDGQQPADRKKSKRVGSRVAFGLSVLVVLSLIASYGTITLAPGLFELDAEPEDFELETVETEYYELSFYAEDRGQVRLLQIEADQRLEQVQDLLGVTSNALILADLTDDSADHLGIAGWKMLRMGRNSLYDPEERLHVFVHETTHVLAAEASNRRLLDHFNYSLFFTEGLAEWVSYEILGLESQRQALRLLSALAWQRLDLRFNDILFSSAFRSQFDQALIYAIGEAWVSTLAEVCGNEAPGAALQAMARPNAPQQIRGSEFWRDTLQSSGCDLTEVNGRFSLLMRDYRSQVAHVPVLTGGIEIQGEQLVASLSLSATDAVESYRVFIRLRDNASVSPADVFSESAELVPGDTITLELPTWMISGQRFQYQLGIEFLPGERPFFSRWIDNG